MELGELSIGLRVRIPAFEKGNAGRGRACHYAYVRDVVDSVFGAEKTVLVSIPVLHTDKAVHPGSLLPARRRKSKSKKGETKK